MNSAKINEKKINFINQIKFAEPKIIFICIKKRKIYKGNDYDKIYEVLSKLRSEDLRINNTLNDLEIMISNKTAIVKQQQVYIKIDKILLD